MSKQANGKLITLPEAAARCRLTWWQAYALATAGKLGPLQREGGRYRLRLADVERYAAQLERRRPANS